MPYDETHWGETILLQPMWKTFSMNCYFTGHLKTHSVEKPYQCSHCDKVFFSRNSDLTSHFKTHSWEKP